MVENYRFTVYLAPVTTEPGTEAVRYRDLEFRCDAARVCGQAEWFAN